MEFSVDKLKARSCIGQEPIIMHCHRAAFDLKHGRRITPAGRNAKRQAAGFKYFARNFSIAP